MTTITVRAWILTLAGIGALGIATARDTLYVRLGGEVGVAAIADELIDRAAADPLMGRSFKDSKLDRIKRLLAEQICELADGPCHYSGDSMQEVHAGHHISQAEFYRLVDTLRGILRERHVDQRSTNELLRLLAPMKRDVVEPAGAASDPTPKGTPAPANPAAQ